MREKNKKNDKTIIDHVFEKADFYNLDPRLVQAIIQVESSFKPNAYRYEPEFYKRYLKNNPTWSTHRLINEPKRISASYGLMQIMFTTAVEFGFDRNRDPEDLYDIELNIDLGCRILRNKINKYGFLLGILSYNSGSPTKRYGTPRQQHNLVYLHKVAKNYKKFEGLDDSIIEYA